MLFRWDPCGIACIVLTYAAVGYADYVVINWLVLPSFQESLWGLMHVVLFNLVLFLIVLSHGRAMVSDPGIVPLPRTQMDFSDLRTRQQQNRSDPGSDSDGSSRGSYVGEDWTVCGRCEAYRPPRAHHCRICRRCVRKMDHHCPWINNCVGEYNQKYFIQFLFYVGIAGLYCIGLVIAAWVWPCADCMTEKIKHTRVLHTIFVSIEASLFCLFVIAVSCDQLQSIFNDETAVEQVQRRGPHRPGKSKRVLLKEVCGPGPVAVWALPCHNVPGKKEYVHMPTYYPV